MARRQLTRREQTWRVSFQDLSGCVSNTEITMTVGEGRPETHFAQRGLRYREEGNVLVWIPPHRIRGATLVETDNA